jgi:hypothetical protein
MKKLLTKGAVLAGLVLATAAAIFLLPVPYSDNLSAIVNKRDMLKDARRDRIVFVGGSGLFDGLDSELIEKRLHRPVVNMGLYAGFGITALLREIAPYLRPGDTVVIVPEYGVVFDSYDYPARKWIFALAPARNLPLLYRTGPDRALAFATDVIGLMRSKLQAFPKAVREAVRTRSCDSLVGEGYAYYRKYFNPCGDSLRTMRASAPGMIEQMGADLFADARYRDQSFGSVSAFCRDARQKGERTFFFFPAYPAGEYQRQQDGMRRYEQRLRKELDCPVLGTPRDFLYPNEYFTNTVNHINNAARRMRTEKLLGYLEKAMERREKE